MATGPRESNILPLPPGLSRESARIPHVSSSRLESEIARQLGQMLMVGFPGHYITEGLRLMIEKYHIGNILLTRENIKDATQVASLTRELQAVARAAGHSRPLLIAVEQENGLTNIFGEANVATQFPGSMAIGASRSPSLAFDVAKATALELMALGINWNMAPVLDVIDYPIAPKVGLRAFGDDPRDVGRFGVTFTEGMRSVGVGNFAKYFPGSGTTLRGGRLGCSLFTNKHTEELESPDLVPFRRVIAAGLAGIILSPSISDGCDGMPLSHIIRDILRNELRFDGLVVSEASESRGRSPCSDSIMKAINDGCDMVIISDPSKLPANSLDDLYKSVIENYGIKEHLRRSFDRILLLKDHYLKWRGSSVSGEGSVPQEQLISKHRELARRAYEAVITIVRDDTSILPISKQLAGNDSIVLLSPVVRPMNIATSDQNKDPFEPFGRSLALRHPRVRHVPYTQHGIMETHTGLISVANIIVFVYYSASGLQSDACQLKIASAVNRLCRGKPLICVAVGDPFDMLMDRSFGTYICTFDYTSTALETAAAVIFGERHASGMLPFQRTMSRQQRRWQVEIWEKRRDLFASADLWKDCLGHRWPLDEATLSVLLDRPGFSRHFIVKNPVSNELLGLCATYSILAGDVLVGSLAVLLVRPSHRGLGIGLSLHDVAVRSISSMPGISSMHLGSIYPRFFPGLPVELPLSDQEWFAHRGWRMEDNYIYDLYMDIESWTLPEDVFGPLSARGVTFGVCSPELFRDLVHFEEKHFSAYPGWVDKYHALKLSDDIADAVLAFSDRAIIGAAVIFSPVGNNQIARDIPWPRVIGDRVGGMACVGMGPEYRGQGAGLGLVCAALLELKNRGLRGCFVDWSTDRAIYERLGFQVWGKYRSSAWRKL